MHKTILNCFEKDETSGASLRNVRTHITRHGSDVSDVDSSQTIENETLRATNGSEK
jgi:hypothetical protein